MNLEKNVPSPPCASDTCTPGTIRRSSEMNSLNLFSANDQAGSSIKIKFQKDPMHKISNFLIIDKIQ